MLISLFPTQFSVKNVDASGAALSGTISGNVNLDTDKKNLSVLGGDYKYEGNISIGSGSLVVSADSNSQASNLTVNGNITLDRTKDKTGSITVSGTNAQHTASLDLTNATIAFNKETARSVTIQADKHATVKIGGTQLTDLINESGTSGALFDTKSGGTLLVDGNLTLTNKQLSGGTTNKGIKLAGGGLVQVDGQLVLNNH